MATIHLPPDFKEFLRYLSLHKVDYLLVDVCLISLEDLKTNKVAAGRHKDLTDLENLP